MIPRLPKLAGARRFQGLLALMLACLMAGCAQLRPANPGVVRITPEEAAIADELRERIGTLQVTFSLPISEDSASSEIRGLRSVMLYTPTLRLEPESLWPDGTPVSAAVRISEADAERLIESLLRSRALAGAGAYSSRRMAGEEPPPEGTQPREDYRRPEISLGRPVLSVTAITTSEQWYTYRIADHEDLEHARRILNAAARSVPREAAEPLRELRQIHARLEQVVERP